MTRIEVYTDGSATVASKPGGWAFVLVIDGILYKEGSGGMDRATNNDAELEAAIEGLKCAKEYLLENPGPNTVSLMSDSQIVLGWASGKYGFNQEKKRNKYIQLIDLMSTLEASTFWVKGHSGVEYNERCDKLANEARLKLVNKEKNLEKKESGESLIGLKKQGITCIWYKDTLKIIDLENNVIENFDREKHGPRGSLIEVREEKFR